MKKNLLFYFCLFFSFYLTACTNTAPHTLQIPETGTNEWVQWVENQVHTTDNQGHGPDIGSEEWCFAVEHKLLNSKSGLKPCSMEWSQYVTQTLLNQ